ncbi:MAG TPA: class E sortase [Pseudonocardiaceae bacterium]|nr:class E sortase [Pseudonocardiaceae bacterium]
MSQQPPVPPGTGDGWPAPRHRSRPGPGPGEHPTEFIPRVADLHGSGAGGHQGGFADDAAETGYIGDGRPLNPDERYDEDYPADSYADDGGFGDDRDGYADGYDHDGYDEGYDDDSPDRAESPVSRPPVAAGGRARTAVRTAGELCLTAGLVVLLFVVYEVYVTNIFSAQKQSTATAALNKEWDTVGSGRSTHYNVTEGQGIAKMFIPALGADYQFTIIEGTNANDLAIGPGHYIGTQLPGQPGNFAVAGHRVGEGAPFDDLALVQPCDAIIVETQSDWFVYRMLPLKSQRADWATTGASQPLCNGPDGDSKVQPLGGEYSQTDGEEIVLPTEGDVVAPVPHYPYTNLSSGQEVALMTLTTCNPKFSDVQRLILHAVLVKDWQKDPSHPNYTPPELKETS